MFRFYKIASHLTQIGTQNKVMHLHTQTRQQRLVTIQRFYSKKRDDCPECPPPEKPPCKAPEPLTPECKPTAKLHPCVAKPVDCNYGKKPLPMYHDCPIPSLMDDLPKLKCPYEENNNRARRKYLIALILGTLLFIATCIALYKVTKPEIKEEKKKRRMRPKVIKKIPPRSKDIPNQIPYLLIGGGTASFSAFRAIKSADPQAKVLVISNEGDNPYMRPPLSKEIWFNTDPAAVENLMFRQWNGSERSLFYEPNDFYATCKGLLEKEKGGVAIAKGWSVDSIDVSNKTAFLEDGYAIKYDNCLIATGASPKNLDLFANADETIQNKVTLYRDIFDFQELYEITEEAEAIAVIGGGFLGSELACALSRKGGDKLTVFQIFKEGGNMGKILPEYLSSWTTEKVRVEGVQIVPYAEVTGVSLNFDEKLELTLNNNKTITVDHVIVAIGVKPNTKLAKKSGLEIDPDLGGFLVNTELQARSNLFIAGDCACFYDTKLGRRRVEHHDHAVVSGRLAGENMTGAAKPYWHQSMFWSDLGPDVGYEAIGIVDSSLPTVGVFAKASNVDNPQAVVTASDEGIRSTMEEKVPPECRKFIKQDPEQQKLAEQIRREKAKAGIGEDFGKGVIFYLRNDIVVGIVLWNVFNRMNIARQVLKDERKYDDLNEVAKLFNIHDEEE